MHSVYVPLGPWTVHGSGAEGALWQCHVQGFEILRSAAAFQRVVTCGGTISSNRLCTNRLIMQKINVRQPDTTSLPMKGLVLPWPRECLGLASKAILDLDSESVYVSDPI